MNNRQNVDTKKYSGQRGTDKTNKEDISLKIELENIRLNNLTRLDQARWHWNSLSNARIIEFSKNLITTASLVIPLILVILGTENISRPVTLLDRTLLSIALTLLMASLVFGVKHIRREANFFDSWGEVENKRAEIFSKPLTLVDKRTAIVMLYDMLGKSDNLQNNLKTKSNDSDLYAQLTLVIIGIFLITFVAIRVLNFPGVR